MPATTGQIIKTDNILYIQVGQGQFMHVLIVDDLVILSGSSIQMTIEDGASES